jgi:hypothetical protein
MACMFTQLPLYGLAASRILADERCAAAALRTSGGKLSGERQQMLVATLTSDLCLYCRAATASWISHVQARSLMQQLRLRLLNTPPGWLPSERPSLTTVVAAGLVEMGALDAEQRDKFLAASANGAPSGPAAVSSCSSPVLRFRLVRAMEIT